MSCYEVNIENICHKNSDIDHRDLTVCFFVCAGLLLLSLLPVFTSGFICLPFLGFNCDNSHSPLSEGRSTSWLTMMSCTANQVPKLPSNFSKPLYQYLFEVFARNTHLLPLGVPMQSKSEDFKTTATYESCLWGGVDGKVSRDDFAAGNEAENDIDSDSLMEENVYQQLFASRQGGYDSLTGFSLLGGKIVAALIGYIIYTLNG